MMSTYPDSSQPDLPDPLPSQTHHVRHHGHKRRATLEYPKFVFFHVVQQTTAQHLTSGDLLSLSDQNIWYYPMHGHDSDEEELPVALPQGNWGYKNAKGGRWVRQGKITAWGPEMEDWEVRLICTLITYSIRH